MATTAAYIVRENGEIVVREKTGDEKQDATKRPTKRPTTCFKNRERLHLYIWHNDFGRHAYVTAIHFYHTEEEKKKKDGYWNWAVDDQRPAPPCCDYLDLISMSPKVTFEFTDSPPDDHRIFYAVDFKDGDGKPLTVDPELIITKR